MRIWFSVNAKKTTEVNPVNPVNPNLFSGKCEKTTEVNSEQLVVNPVNANGRRR